MVAIEIFLLLALVFAILYLIWFLFLTDADLTLALAEKFGRRISAYRGKVIWITGASTGLGEAMAYELASVGAKLILSARKKNLLQEVKKKCLEKAKGKLKGEDILVLPLDVSQCDEHKNNVGNVLNHFGQIDVLINNAARYQVGPIAQTSDEMEKELFAVNFFGNIGLTRVVLKHFTERSRGQIVVITSVAGKCGIASHSSYCATKFALQGYYEALRMEYASKNISVTKISPGIFKSSMYTQTVFVEKNHTELQNYMCAQMTSERCAYLTLVAAVNELGEAWVSYQPFHLMMWAAQYFPDISRRTMVSLVYNKRRIKELNKGEWPKDLPTWQPFFH